MAPIMLIFFCLMLMVGGIAVDVMRFETKRVAVQNTMDRATLAAASLKQTLAPSTVVQDYFDKAGLGQDLDNIQVQQGMNFRVVSATATVTSKNFFMSMMEVPQLTAGNSSQAEERISNVEIAMVLDVSGSMYNEPNYTRIAALKKAGKEFVDTVLANDTENKISISLVPYNGQVNLGKDIFDRYTSTEKHDFANAYCLDLPTSTFNSTSLSRTEAFPQTPFADTFSATSATYVSPDNTDYARVTYNSRRGLYTNVWCQPVQANIVRLHSNNRQNLKSQIDGLVPVGATSIDLGMKWGTVFLDPSSRPVTQGLHRAGLVSADFADRPADYSTLTTPVDKQTMKVIILMTDGENFRLEDFKAGYRVGAAQGTANGQTYQVWSATDGNYSVFFDSKVNANTQSNPNRVCRSLPYWVPHLNKWHSKPWNGTNYAQPTSTTSAGHSSCYVPDQGRSNAAITTWQNLWQNLRMQYVTYHFFGRALTTSNASASTISTTWMNTFRALTTVETMDTRLGTICDAAKAKGILVYSIAFESAGNDVDALRNCSSSPREHYFFDVKEKEMSTAFAQIASNLSQLRLTQ